MVPNLLLGSLLLLPQVSAQFANLFDPLAMAGRTGGGFVGGMSPWDTAFSGHGLGQAPMPMAPAPPSVAGVEEQMAEVLSETPRNNPERQRLDRLIQTSGGRLRGSAEPLNYLIQEYLMTSPAPTPPPNQNMRMGNQGGRWQGGRAGNGGQQQEVEQQAQEGQVGGNQLANNRRQQQQGPHQQQPRQRPPSNSPWGNQAPTRQQQQRRQQQGQFQQRQQNNRMGWQGPSQKGGQNRRQQQQQRQRPRPPVTPPPATQPPTTQPTPPPEPKAKLTKLRPTGQGSSILGERLRLIQKRIDLMTEVQRGVTDSNQHYEMQQKINELTSFRDTLQGKTPKKG